MSRPQPKPGILDIAAYVPGKSGSDQAIKPVKLSSNESPLGSSAKAIEAVRLLENLQDYPDASSDALRQAIADTHLLNSDNIICGNGSDDLLAMIANAYLAPGDEAIFTEHGFLLYPVIVRGAGATPVIAPETDCHASVDAILGCVSERTKIVFLANPNNPTGTYIPNDEVRRLHSALPSHVLLVLDAAYAEYVQRNDYESGIELVSAHENVVMTRTFSKIHGLASLRIGWAYGPAHLIDALNRIRGPFNVNSAAIAAGSVAIKDSAHIAKCVEHNLRWVSWVSEALCDIGLKVTPSVGNFILIHFRDDNRSAAAADKMLADNGLILRAVTGYGFPNALRMTIGDEAANRKVVDVLTKFMNNES